MDTLYLRIPAQHTATWPHQSVAYALCAADGALSHSGQSQLSALAPSIAGATVVLLIAAADVTLLGLTIPPMTEAKLKLALPTLVEEQLMGDVAESVIVVSGKETTAHLRSIAIAQRGWLQQLATSLFALGASQIKALPAQLCLPWAEGRVTVCLTTQDGCGSFSMRTAQDLGTGWLVEAHDEVSSQLAAVMMLLPAESVLLIVQADQLGSYQQAIAVDPEWAARVEVQADAWPVTLQATKTVGINLMAGLTQAQTNRIQWQTWRWPLTLAVLVLLLNIIGLNSEYWVMKREARALKLSMEQTFKSSFPKETVILFPLEQMKKNLGLAQRNAGQSSSSDFTLLLSEFGSAWTSLPANQLPKLVSIEYKDHGLLLQVKGELPQQPLQMALSAKGLMLKKTNADIWQVRVAK